MVRRTKLEVVEPTTKTNINTEHKKRKRRRKQVSSQIRRLRLSSKPIIPLSYFQRIFREVAPGFRVQKRALKALRECTEREGHGLFEASVAVMNSSNKHSLTKEHLEAAKHVPMLRMGNA